MRLGIGSSILKQAGFRVAAPVGAWGAKTSTKKKIISQMVQFIDNFFFSKVTKFTWIETNEKSIFRFLIFEIWSFKIHIIIWRKKQRPKRCVMFWHGFFCSRVFFLQFFEICVYAQSIYLCICTHNSLRVSVKIYSVFLAKKND